MDSMDLQVLATVRRWAAEGRRFALVTVAATWGSAPRPPGSWLALRDDGQVLGSVSGGCIEDDLIARMRQGGMREPTAFKLVYGATQDEALRYGLPCGGRLEVVVEPMPNPAQLEQLAALLTQRRLASRHVDLATGTVSVGQARAGEALRWDGSGLTTLHGPQWRLLIIGAGQVSQYLARMAQALDYEVTVCDPREEYGRCWDVPDARLVTSMPDDAFLAMEPDPRCAVVALTHDPKLDDMLLLEVGAIGSRLNNARRQQRLAQHFDMTDAQLARLHGPVGLPIGSHTPPEIAVAILAEMTAVKNGVSIVRRDACAVPAADSAACP